MCRGVAGRSAAQRPANHREGSSGAQPALEQPSRRRCSCTLPPRHLFERKLPALHCGHLRSLEEKAALLRDIHRCLAPGGVFIDIDKFRRDGEPREAWLARYLQRIQERMTEGEAGRAWQKLP